jgi:hypothetical protein
MKPMKGPIEGSSPENSRVKHGLAGKLRLCDMTLSRAKQFGRSMVDMIHLALLHHATFGIITKTYP